MMNYQQLIVCVAVMAAALQGASLGAADMTTMTCTAHGPNAMTLKYVREDGVARQVLVLGTNSGQKWTVKIDNHDVTPPTQTKANPGEIRIHSGDTILWRVDAGTHGILFPTKADAEGLFQFDTTQGQELADRTGVDGFKWGTKKVPGVTVLAAAKVRSIPPMARPLSMTCTEHGPEVMTLKYVREEGKPRQVEVIGTMSTEQWTVKIDGKDVTPATQTNTNPGEVKLHAGDTVTWRVADGTHGGLFTTKAAATAFFQFKAGQGKEMADRPELEGFKWGTLQFPKDTVLAVAVVTAVGDAKSQ